MPIFENITQSASTPEVRYQNDDCKMIICGESYPENSFHFYAPIITFVKERAAAGPFTLEINISYMNSSSTKCMLDLLDLLEECHQKHGEISVIWRFDKDNPRSLDLAEEFREEVTLPFTIIESAG